VIAGVIAIPFSSGTLNKILVFALVILTRTTPLGIPVPEPAETTILKLSELPTVIDASEGVIAVTDVSPVTVSAIPAETVAAYVPSPE
jgi:hypothetical protein